MQEEIFSAWPELSAGIASEKDLHRREELMTEAHMQMSEEAQELALTLYRTLASEK